MRNTFLLLSVLSVFIISSCRRPKELVYEGVKDFNLRNASIAHPELGMQLKFYNPNNYALLLKNADVDVFVNGNHLGKVNLSVSNYMIPKLDTCLIPVTLNVDMQRAFPNAFQLLTKKDVDVHLQGFIKAGRKGVYIHIPVNYDGRQSLNM